MTEILFKLFSRRFKIIWWRINFCFQYRNVNHLSVEKSNLKPRFSRKIVSHSQRTKFSDTVLALNLQRLLTILCFTYDQIQCLAYAKKLIYQSFVLFVKCFKPTQDKQIANLVDHLYLRKLLIFNQLGRKKFENRKRYKNMKIFKRDYSSRDTP